VSRMIKASEFKAKCLALMDHVERTGEPVVITKHGKPVAELVAHRPRRPKALGLLKDRLLITGDIISPIDIEWTRSSDRARRWRSKVKRVNAER
jgi:prevent-host-death family protein